MLEKVMENIELIATIVTTASALLIGFRKKIRGLFLAPTEEKQKELKLQAEINELKNAEIKEAWDTVKRYQEINRRQNESAEAQINLLKRRDDQLGAYRLQLDEQDSIISKLRKGLEAEQAYAEQLRKVIKKQEEHMKYYEALLTENDIVYTEFKTKA